MRNCSKKSDRGRCANQHVDINCETARTDFPAGRDRRATFKRGCAPIPPVPMKSTTGAGLTTSVLIRRLDQLESTIQICAFARRILTTLAPVVLFILTFVVMHIGGGWFTRSDLAFLCVLAAFVVGRDWEIRQGRSEAAHREPPTAVVLFFGLAIWAVANILGNSLLTT